MHGSKQLAQRKKEATGQQSVLVEDNLYEVATSIPTQKATNMKDIAHHAQRAIVRQGFTARQACGVGLLLPLRSRSVEPLMSPDNYIVGQSARQSVFCPHRLSSPSDFKYPKILAVCCASRMPRAAPKLCLSMA